MYGVRAAARRRSPTTTAGLPETLRREYPASAVSFRRQRLSFGRRFIVDSMRLGARKHAIHGLVEVDVSRARTLIAESEVDLSFTALVAATLGRAIAAHPIVHACRSWRGDVVLFDDVDICVMVESERSDRSTPMPLVLRRADSRSVAELTADIRRAQASPRPVGSGLLKLAGYIPGPLRRAVMGIALRNPGFVKKTAGTAAVTSVGMFGDSPGFGIAFPTFYTMGLVVGSITERVVLEPDGRAVGREHLHLTLTFDHDIVDGGPAARFSSELVEGLTSAAVLDESGGA